jgi:Ca-activated chloride channel family protein
LLNLLHPWFAHPWAVLLLVLLPVLAVCAWVTTRQRRRKLARFGTLAALRALGPRRRGLGILRSLCYVSGLLFLIAGIMGPQWGREWDQSAAPGRDLVIVLDLSQSMLAQDVLPNRFERAREAVRELSYTIQQRGGHRLALVAFAARARLVCPLTHDYDHFRMALADLDVTVLHPDLRATGSEAVSGTRIGAGLRAAALAHDERFAGYQDILLISDGDDPVADNGWREGAEQARLLKIPVHTIGIGNPDAGSPIPLGADQVLLHENQVVLTRLEEKPLEDIARWTGGTYTPARTSALPLGELFRERIEPRAAHEDSDDPLPVYRQQFALFLGPALTLLGMHMTLGQRRRKPAVKQQRKEA